MFTQKPRSERGERRETIHDWTKFIVKKSSIKNMVYICSVRIKIMR